MITLEQCKLSKAEREEIETRIRVSVSGTIGYYESSDQKEFMKGVEVAVSKACNLLINRIEVYKHALEVEKERRNEIAEDFHALNKILEKYKLDN